MPGARTELTGDPGDQLGDAGGNRLVRSIWSGGSAVVTAAVKRIGRRVGLVGDSTHGPHPLLKRAIPRCWHDLSLETRRCQPREDHILLSNRRRQAQQLGFRVILLAMNQVNGAVRRSETAWLTPRLVALQAGSAAQAGTTGDTADGLTASLVTLLS